MANLLEGLPEKKMQSGLLGIQQKIGPNPKSDVKVWIAGF